MSSISCIEYGLPYTFTLNECDEIQEFVKLICTQETLETREIYFEKILLTMNSPSFSKTFNDLIQFRHDCIGFSYDMMNFDVIEFLREKDYITFFDEPNKFNLLDMLYVMFSTLAPKISPVVEKYIDYFWTWVEKENPISLIDYINKSSQISMSDAILNGNNKLIRSKYIDKFIILWKLYNPSKELTILLLLNQSESDGDNSDDSI